ncbi:MAG: Macrocin O-methyltransferase [Betaproteobacteria bacterium ADurb.Bin341]|nr:MAG: Macrocin O-methyltransferase [Betaproteobacteria bacterium ADurb.Bin341]
MSIHLQPTRWVKSFIRKFLNRRGYLVVRTELFTADQAELQQLRHAVQGAAAPVASADLLELLSQPVPSPSRPAAGLYTPIFSYDGLINDPKVIHNHDFMRNPRYIKAYEVAERALGYDHKMFWRLHVALWCATQAQKLPGDFVECGVWRGFLATAIMNYIPWPSEDKQFYLFDTWEGLDERFLTEGERNNKAKLEHFKPYYANQYESVKTHFSNYPNVHLIKGSVPETLGTVEIGSISYLSLDMNCAPPELAAAEYFWDRIVPGGMILLDDYGFVSYEDQKRGFDDFAAKHGVEILALPTGQGLLIKPASTEHSQQIRATFGNVAGVEAVMRSVVKILTQEGINSQPNAETNIGNLVGLYHGYRSAYHAVSQNKFARVNESEQARAAYTSQAKSRTYLPTMLKPRQLAFMHIGKTAGTSFHYLLRRAMPLAAVFNGSPEQYDLVTKEGLEEYDLLLGHFSFWQSQKFRRNKYLITFLREPVDRVVSSYFFLRSWKGVIDDTNREAIEASRQLDLMDFVRSNVAHVRAIVENHQTYVLGADWRTPRSQIKPSLLEEAIQHLQSIQFVGLTERYDESVRLIFSDIELDDVPPIERLNFTPQRPAINDISMEVRSLIEEKNQFDIRLYEEARRLFDEQASRIKGFGQR